MCAYCMCVCVCAVRASVRAFGPISMVVGYIFWSDTHGLCTSTTLKYETGVLQRRVCCGSSHHDDDGNGSHTAW